MQESENQTEKKIEALREALSDKLSASVNPALLWSGGRDSTLLLKLLLELCPDIAVIQYRADFRPAQLAFSNRLIREWQFRVIYYSPQKRYFIPNGDAGEVTLVDEYSLGNNRSLPVLRDVVHDDNNCALALDPRRQPEVDFNFDVCLVGWRKTDTHRALGRYVLPDSVRLGGTELVAPLFDFSPAEVKEMAEFLNLPESEFYSTGDEKLDTGNFVACSRCLSTTEKVFCPRLNEEIEGTDWARHSQLEAFRNRLHQ